MSLDTKSSLAPTVTVMTTQEAPTSSTMTTSTTTSTSQVNPSGQYRATRIFCEIVDYVFTNLPLKRHWRNFRTYSDCFAASEAIDWLCRNLKPNTNTAKPQTPLTRQQAVQLLQFFLREKIIEDVRVGEKVNTKDLQDDDRLYKFCYTNKYLINRSRNLSVAANPSESTKISEASTTSISSTSSKSTSTGHLISTSVASSTCSLKRAGSIRVKSDNKENYIKLTTTTAGFKDDKQLLNELDMNTRAALVTAATNSVAGDKAPAVNCDSQLPIIKLEMNKELLRTVETGSKSLQISKSESEVWARVARKFLEAILRKSVLNHMQLDAKIKLDSTKRELELFTKHIDVRISRFLEENNMSGGATSSLISGAHLHHNCTHVNKHGVVINTSGKNDDLPPWLVKAMTTLLYWNSENEKEQFPKFDDIFVEVNNYFMELAEPLLTKKISRLFISIMIFLLTQSQQQQQQQAGSFISTTSAAASSEATANEFSVSRFNESGQTTASASEISNESYLNFARNFQAQLGYHAPMDMTSDGLEAKLVENAKLAFIPPPCLTIGSANGDDATEFGLIETDAGDSRLPSFTSQLDLPMAGEDELPFGGLNPNWLNWNGDNNPADLNEFLNAIKNLASVSANEFSTLAEPSENEPLQFADKSTYDRRTSMAAQYKRPSNLLEPSEAEEEEDGENDLIDLDDEEEDEEDEDDMGLKKFATISLSSPRLHQTSKTMMKERKLRRNNSFKAAIGRTPPVQRNSCARKTMEKKRAKYDHGAGVGGGVSLSPKASKSAKSSSNLRSVSHAAAVRFRDQTDQDYYDCYNQPPSGDREFRFKVPEPIDMRSVGSSGIQKSKSMNFAGNEYKNLAKRLEENIFDASNHSDAFNEDTNEANNIKTIMYKRRTSGHLAQQAAALSNSRLLSELDPTRHAKLISHLNALNLIQTNAHSCSSLNRIQDEMDKRNQTGADSTMQLSSSLFNLSSIASQSTDGGGQQSRLSTTQNDSIYSYRSECLFNRNPRSKFGGGASFKHKDTASATTFSDVSYLSKISDSLSLSVQKQQSENLNLSLQDGVESDALCFMVKAFRICALMLPPSSKRKLHLLLRFMNKLIDNKHTSDNLLASSLNTSSADPSLMLSEDYEDLNYIDASTLTAKSGDMNLTTDHSSIAAGHHSLLSSNVFQDKSQQHRKSQHGPMSKAKTHERTKAIEKVLVKAFFKAIVHVEKSEPGESGSSQPTSCRPVEERLAMKLVQILVNNYTEIMRIPDDYLSNVQHKLTKLARPVVPVAQPEAGARSPPVGHSSSASSLSTTTQLDTNNETTPKTIPTRFCSKMSLQQYEMEKAENSRKHLSDLLNRILTDKSMKEDERLMRLKKFKESHPDVYEEKYPQIKKALSILGISETASYLIIQTDDNIGRKRMANHHHHQHHLHSTTLGITPSKKLASILASRNANTTLLDSTGGSSSASALSSSYMLNQTALPFVSTTKSTVSSMFTNTTKFFLNKNKVKAQKENK